jgi:outer membrane protein assembly factor BamB
MKKRWYKKGFVLGIIVLFIAVTFIPSINGNVEKNNEDQSVSEIVSESLPISEVWPVYQYDSQRTGYTTSDAPDTNNLRWTAKTTYTSQRNSPVIDDDRLYIGRKARLFCFNAHNGSRLWHFDTSDYIGATPGIADGKVYVADIDRIVYCINANNGSLIWTYSSGNIMATAPVIINKRVYIGATCLNAENGTLIYHYPIGHNVYGNPAVDNGKVYIGSFSNKLHCINADNGSEIWTYETNNKITGSPTVKDEKVYIGSWDSILYCLNAENGSLIWSYDSNDEIHTSPAIAYGKVYLGIYYKMYCFDAEDGSIVWDFTTDAYSGWSAPAVADGKVYFGSNDRNVYCLDAYTGEKIWNYTTWDNVMTSPAIAYGNVYIGSDDGWIFCFGNPNNPPSMPIIDGPTSGEPNTEYDFSFNATDPEGDAVMYIVDWGDSDTEWTEYGDSGVEIILKHTWDSSGKYTIRAQAIDIHGAESDWSEFIVTMPRDKSTNNQLLLLRLLERFPLLQKLLFSL